MVSTLQSLAPYVLRYRWRYALGLGALVLKTGLAVLVPRLIGQGIDSIKEGVSFQDLLILAAIILTISAAKSVFQFWMRWILIVLSRRIEFDLRDDVFGHLTTLPQRFYQTFRTGDLMSRVTNDMNAVRMMLGPGIMYLADVLLTFAFVLSLMSAMDWQLTCLAFLPIPLVSLTVNYFGQQMHHRFRKVQERLSEISSFVQENLSSIRLIRAYALERYSVDQFATANDAYFDDSKRLIHIWGRFYPLLEVLIGCTFVIILWFGGGRVLDGTLTLGQFVMFQTYMLMLTWPMIGIGFVVNIWQRGAASLKRLNEIRHFQPEIADTSDTDLTLDQVRGDIEFKNVSFAYPGSDQQALSGIDLFIPAGQMVAILGATGSGKTTLVSLVPRLIDASDGSIEIDRTPVERIPLGVLRQAIGFVPQDPFLFSKTIGENLAFGVPEAEKWQLEEAADLASLLGDIQSFPDGLETIVGERGVTLSGGQKQRATLARALLRDPRILVLDDAMSSVDAETEARILSGLQSIRRNRTTLIVTHRASTARLADLVVVIHDGRVAEKGGAEELLRQEGAFHQLLQRQELEEALARA